VKFTRAGDRGSRENTHSHTANSVMPVSLAPFVYWLVRMTNQLSRYPILGPLLPGGPPKDRIITRPYIDVGIRLREARGEELALALCIILHAVTYLTPHVDVG
jgi:hypothetical protein